MSAFPFDIIDECYQKYGDLGVLMCCMALASLYVKVTKRRELHDA